MSQPFSYLHERQWINEGAPFYFKTTLTDERGVVIPSSALATCVLSLFDLSVTPSVLLPGTWPVDIKNVSGGRGTINTQGVLEVTLAHTAATADDTAILSATHSYEQRKMLIEYTRTTSGKTDCLEVLFVVRNVAGRPTPP